MSCYVTRQVAPSAKGRQAGAGRETLTEDDDAARTRVVSRPEPVVGVASPTLQRRRLAWGLPRLPKVRSG